MILSLHSPPKKQFYFIFDLVCACGHQMCQQQAARVPFFVSLVLVVPQPVGVHVLNQLTNCSVWFNSRSYASLPGEMTHVFNHFKSPCQSEKQKTSSQVINLVKKHTPNFPGRIYLQKSFCALYSQRRAPSMLSAAPASWDFSVAHGGIYIE